MIIQEKEKAKPKKKILSDNVITILLTIVLIDQLARQLYRFINNSKDVRIGYYLSSTIDFLWVEYLILDVWWLVFLIYIIFITKKLRKIHKMIGVLLLVEYILSTLLGIFQFYYLSQ